jgi:CBS domain-containing protein
MENQTVGDVMVKNPIVISPEDTLSAAFGVMNRKHIRSLPVLKDDKIVGIITRYDLKKYPIRNYSTISVECAMSKNPHLISKDEELSEALNVMYRLHCGSLIVADKNKKLLGFIAKSDIKRISFSGSSRRYIPVNSDTGDGSSKSDSENQKWVCEVCHREFTEKEDAISHERRCKIIGPS